jgi:predicted dehydrogenase/threonine dehydrogenase-like Zn-dependent dehydrogenase
MGTPLNASLLIFRTGWIGNMKQVIIRQGNACVEEIPAPGVESGTILVKVARSCISIGTEMAGVKAASESLLRRVLKRPEQVKKVLQMVAQEGLARTADMVKGRLSAGLPVGYSAAGVVVAVGEGVDDMQIGQRVACAGAQCAYHAEIIRVPRNLATSIPEPLSFDDASTVTLGAIALQGVRRALPTLGECFVVVGLGILGQLTVQLLKANGCRVIGADLDSTRIDLAMSLGMDIGINPADGDDILKVLRFTGGFGADGVIITAATPSDTVMSTAFHMCRKKGRVVLVGDVGLNLNRSDFYLKELDFFISTSYGPGRYDQNYEEGGLDYPISYVRWTENRNMGEYLHLIAEGKIKVAPLIGATYEIDKAPVAYDALKQQGPKPLMVLLSYPEETGPSSHARKVGNPVAVPKQSGKIQLAVVGAGSYAKGMHLPILRALADRYRIRAVVSRTGHNAKETAATFEADYASTDFRDVLNDPDVDAVLIATRHNLHASMVLEALQSGKHVLVEKPLSLTTGEMEGIEAFFAAGRQDAPVLLTGFNRRFSRYARRIKEWIETRSNPMVINYKMNAGYIPLDHWVHTSDGGGRNRGEACHIYDLFTYLTGSRVTSVQAQAITPATGYYSRSDNFVALLKFEDGTVATLTYTALGARDYPKETMEIFVDGKVIVMDDYKRLTLCGGKSKGIETRTMDKGQKEELEAFALCIREGGGWPIPLWQQLQATRMAIDVERSLMDVEHMHSKRFQ